MAKKKTNKRPAVLVRFYLTDLQELNRVCAQQCTPRENFCRRAILERLQDIRLGTTPPGKSAGT